MEPEDLSGSHLNHLQLQEKEFRTADQEIVDTATLFVNQLIEQAQQEVMRKKVGNCLALFISSV